MLFLLGPHPHSKAEGAQTSGRLPELGEWGGRGVAGGGSGYGGSTGMRGMGSLSCGQGQALLLTSFPRLCQEMGEAVEHVLSEEGMELQPHP